MLFAERIKQLREISHLPQKSVAEVLGVDVPMYSRIERGQRKAKKEFLPLLSRLYNVEFDELNQLWLADRVYDVIADEEMASQVLNIVAENLLEYNKSPRAI